jgi:hypothetical protein
MKAIEVRVLEIIPLQNAQKVVEIKKMLSRGKVHIATSNYDINSDLGGRIIVHAIIHSVVLL